MAPFKSEAQRKKFAELVATGKMSKQTFDEWNHATADRVLPERVTPQVTPKEKNLRQWEKNENARKKRLKERG